MRAKRRERVGEGGKWRRGGGEEEGKRKGEKEGRRRGGGRPPTWTMAITWSLYSSSVPASGADMITWGRALHLIQFSLNQFLSLMIKLYLQSYKRTLTFPFLLPLSSSGILR